MPMRRFFSGERELKKKENFSRKNSSINDLSALTTMNSWLLGNKRLFHKQMWHLLVLYYKWLFPLKEVSGFPHTKNRKITKRQEKKQRFNLVATNPVQSHSFLYLEKLELPLSL